MTEIEQAWRPPPTAAAVTRLRPPRLFTRPIDRVRLRRRLDDQGWKVAVLAARAAAGKTTLLAEWAARRTEPIAWLTCDRAERDPALLARALLSALGVATRPDRSGAEPGAVEAVAPVSEHLTELLATLATITHPIVIVIDDYHLLDASSAGPVLDSLVDETPGNVRLVLSGRGRPPLRVARLRMHGLAVTLDDDDMALDDGEAVDMLRDSLGLHLSDVDARAVHRRCEGWAGGVCLVAMALQRRRGDVAGVLASMERAGSNVGDLLLDEVLGAMDSDDVDFLLRVSLLDRLHPALCAAVTGRRDAGHRLAALHRGIGFVVAVDDELAPYRLHTLFRNVLRDRADALLQHEVVDVHQRAAGWLQANGFEGEAVDHLLAAGDVGHAARAIRRVRASRQFLTDLHRQHRWLNALPDAIVAADRDLANGRLMSRFLVDGELAAGTGEPTSASEAILDYIVAAMAGDLAGEERLGEAAHALATRSDPPAMPYTRSLLGCNALAFDRLDDARDHLVAAAAISDTFEITKALVNIYLAILADQRGDTAELVAASAKAVSAQPREHRRYTDMQQLAVAFLAEQRGDVAGALSSLHCFVEGDPTATWPRWRLVAWLRIARLEAAAGAPDAAEAAREAAQKVLDAMRTPGPWCERLAREEGLTIRSPEAVVPAPAASPDLQAADLSDRERQVLRMLRGSLSLREIADELYVSHNTIKTHAKSIYRKLGVTQRNELRDPDWR